VGPEDDPVLDLNVQASLDAAWLRPFVADLDVSGRIAALGRVGGTLARPRINGQADVADGRFLPPAIPHTVEHLRALAWFYPDAVVLDRLDAAFAGGTVTASGRVDLPTGGKPVVYRFEAAARRIAPRWPAGWQLRGDADLSLASTAEGRQLRGEVRLDRIWYLQDIDLSAAQLVQRLLARNRVEVAVTDESLLSTSLGVVVRGPGALRVRNNLARLSGSADLVVRGTLARPVVFGQIAIEPGGTATYAGNTYTVERAAVNFANPSRIEPLLDVVARTRVSEYSVAVTLSGSLERLNANFSSDPPLPDLDILGLLATGAPSEGGTLSELAPEPGAASRESASAGALLYGQAAALLTQRVGKLFGFDQVQVRPLTTGDTLSTAAITVGKRISRQVHVTYSVDPASTAQQVLQVEWRLSDKLVLVLTQNGNESYSVDARWESRY
jgi:translocation and assembly module TamB